MAAAIIALAVEKGATFRHSMQWFASDGVTPINLTGCSIRSQWRSATDSTTVEEELTTANSKIILDATQGIITLHLTASETSLLKLTSYVYDIEVVYPANVDGEIVVTRLARGKIKCSNEVTR